MASSLDAARHSARSSTCEYSRCQASLSRRLPCAVPSRQAMAPAASAASRSRAIALSSQRMHADGFCRLDSALWGDTWKLAPRHVTMQNFTGRRSQSRPSSTSIRAEQPVEELPEKLQKIVKAFQMVPDAQLRYKQLLFYASKLPGLPKDDWRLENKVEGCVSQVFVTFDYRDGLVYYKADSDSQLTKGLAALLVEGLSGSPPESILRVTPDFITQLGLRQSLTPSRSNGFLNMLRLMQKKAKTLIESQTQPSSA